MFLSVFAEAMAETYFQQTSFPYPQIPSVIRNPDERKDYLLRNYWSNFDFSDKKLIDNRNISEQGFVDFISFLSDKSIASEVLYDSMNAFCNGLISNSYSMKVMMAWADDYLYNPNSPMYNEAVYIAYLNCMKNILSDDNPLLYTIDFKIKVVNLNRIGTLAADFAYISSDGKECSMYNTDITNGIILVFYDPECEHCNETIEEMISDVWLNKAVRNRKISVLAIYTEGNYGVWKNTCNTMPDDWIIGYDKGLIRNNFLYDLKAMPTLYLLDRNRKVILKDASYNIIREYIINNLM